MIIITILLSVTMCFGTPNVSHLKNIVSKDCGSLLTEVHRNYTVLADFFAMANIKIISPKYGTHYILVDDEDFELMSKYKWYIKKGKRDVLYAKAWTSTERTDTILMHRLVSNAKKGEIIDHRDNNGLNNQKANLRKCTNSQNLMNSRLHLDSLTKFKGVTLKKTKNLYITRIRLNGKIIRGGSYRDLLIAAQKYNELAIKYFGEFAQINKFSKKEQLLLSDKNRIIPFRIFKTNSTGYRGVSYSAKNHTNPFIATIHADGKNIYLGCFNNAKDAAIIYDKAVIKYKKPLGYLNFK